MLFLPQACGQNPYSNVPPFKSSASWQLLNLLLLNLINSANSTGKASGTRGSFVRRIRDYDRPSAALRQSLT